MEKVKSGLGRLCIARMAKLKIDCFGNIDQRISRATGGSDGEITFWFLEY